MPINLKNDWKDVKASELMVAAGKPDQAQKFVEQLHYHFENAIPDSASSLSEIYPMEDFTIKRILDLYPLAKVFEEKAGKSRSLTNDSGIVMFSLAEGMVEAAKQAFYAKIPPHPSEALISFYFRINKSIKILSFHPSLEHKDMSPEEEEEILSNNRERLSQIYERLYEDHADIFKRDDYTPVIYIISALLERLRNSGRPDGKEACQALDDFVFIMDALNDFETI